MVLMEKMSKLSFGCLLLGLLVLIGCQSKEPVSSINEVPPAELPAYLEQSYRLVPDRRFGLALEELNRLFGQDPARVETIFKNRRWHVYLDGEHLGTLPEFPRFGDLFHILLKRAQTLNRRHPLKLPEADRTVDLNGCQRQLDKFFPPYLFALLRELDDRWAEGIRHPEVLKLGLKALTLLCLQAFDRLDLSDRLLARCLALLALTRVVTPYNLDGEEAMVAYAMGYRAHCERVVEQLPRQDDAFSLFFRRQNQDLKMSAEADGTPLARYLWLLRYAEKGDVSGWQRLWQGFFKDEEAALLPIMKSGFALEHCFMNSTLSNSILRVPAFRGGGEGGGLFGQPMIQRLFRDGYFYSALYTLGIHVLDQLESTDAATFFLEAVEKPDSALTREFLAWYSHLVVVRQRGVDVNLLSGHLNSPGRLRGMLLARTFDEIGRHIADDSPLLVAAARNLVKILDSRLTHRWIMAEVARYHLYDLKYLERLLSGMVSPSLRQFPRWQSWYATLNGDPERLMALLDEPDMNIHTRSEIVNALAGFEEVKSVLIQYEFNKLVVEEPENWVVADQFSAYLKSNGKFRQARRIIREWLENPGTPQALRVDYIDARQKLAALYYSDDQYSQGLKALESVAASYHPQVLQIKSLLLSKIGEERQAERWARQLRQRHPLSVDARTLLVKMYWSHGKCRQAAKLIKSFPFRCTLSDWADEMAAAFVHAFEKKSAQQAMEAFSCLIQQKVDHCLLQSIPARTYRSGNPQLAFQLQRELLSAQKQHLTVLLTAYRYLAEWKDNAAALTWLRRKTPSYLLPMAAEAAYGRQEYELLWQWPIELKRSRDRRYKRLLQAAAALKTGEAEVEESPRWRELKEYYSRQNVYYYDKIGGYLMGFLPRQEVLGWLDTADRRCEIAYFIGLKEESSGRLRRASDWYRLSVETGRSANAAYHWAFETLRRWADQNRFLSHLESQ
jgi:hypothetical protein